MSWRSFCAPKVYSFSFAHFLVCVGFSPPGLLILPREWQSFTVWFQGLGECWKQYKKQDEGFCSHLVVVGGTSDGGRAGAVKVASDILAKCEHLKRRGQVYHCLKQYRSHLKDQSVFEPSLSHSLMAVMVTHKNSVCSKLIPDVPGYSDVLLGRTFLSLPSTHSSAQEASQHPCVSSSSM